MREVVCELCPRKCVIPEGGAGDCRVRVNIGGKLLASTYGRPSAMHIDPMEKKPLYHFHPGSPVFSIATAGCNLHCLNCQNWQLSQSGGEEIEEIFNADPVDLIALARDQGCESIAYTYSDPVVFYEYVYDSSILAHEAGMQNVFITAGYINTEPLRRLCKVIDATNTDLKAFDDRFYRKTTGATLQPVLDALVTFREEGVWLEVTNLLIPTLNDDLSMIRRMAKWIRSELGEGTPLHFSRFHPMYRMRNLPPTPGETLDRARQEAMDAGLKYVYIGNISGHKGNSTYCPVDGTLLIKREGFMISEYNLTSDGHCPTCNEPVPGVWQ
ncbi:MAG: AmmeMemoRadiSam system radical SAM enzyme [gamma proteobacterium endosymbiont of Lamellibrachia anaximandri]|nr:AmmeMemoRadiSam system radical SAM enzyme [gamma proteobacterium endosymbiont of Lamellibrachia anaximandri]MBL3618319.1 AmmeMemoRadiSam system radical SAM enzyme [gamma proteobacterium endosymbiont of Lamellibrachia anaximandri]